jgi:hypothetical protein
MNKFPLLQLMIMCIAPRKRADQITLLRALGNWCHEHADELAQRAGRDGGKTFYSIPPTHAS